MNPHCRPFHLAVFAAIAMSSGSLFAQELPSTSFKVERFEPQPSQGTSIVNVAGSEVMPHMVYTAVLFNHYVSSPLELVQEDGSTEALIDGQLKSEIMGGIGLDNWFELTFALPLVVHQSGGSLDLFGQDGQSVEGFTLTDFRVVPKFQLLDRSVFHGVGLALVSGINLPLGDSDTFNSGDSIEFEPRLVADWVQESTGVHAALNLSYLLRKEQTAQNYRSDDVLRWSLGGRLPISAVAGSSPVMDNLSAVATVFGDVQLTSNRDPSGGFADVSDWKGSPIEALLGAEYKLPMDLAASVGFGKGLNSGIGSPAFRAYLGISWQPSGDKDGDGILGDADQCPEEPEDTDGFEDEDGCPDADNDGDGVPDETDQCGDGAEDADGFQDEDGCPDPDNDGDGFPDAEDVCPNTAGKASYKGCVEGADRDKDGFPDYADKCPDAAEDMNGKEDEDGCPEDPPAEEAAPADENTKEEAPAADEKPESKDEAAEPAATDAPSEEAPKGEGEEAGEAPAEEKPAEEKPAEEKPASESGTPGKAPIDL